MRCTLLALSVQVHAGADQTAVDAGAWLRLLINQALAAGGGDLAEGLTVSFGPKVMVMLAYLNEPDLGRVLRLAEAVQLQLEHAPAPVFPLAGAITQGQVRQVDVLGQSWNFEGYPAIAAARIVARLEPGLLAIEREACSEGMEPLLGESRTILGKHDGEEYAVRLHTRIKFNTTLITKRKGAMRPRSLSAQRQGASKDPGVVALADLAARVGAYAVRRLDIQAFSPSAGAPPLIRERYELLVPAAMTDLVLPLSLCALRDPGPVAKLHVVGVPYVLDGSGPLSINMIESSRLGGRVGLLLQLRSGGRQRAVEVFYRPEPIRGRVCIRLPAMTGQRINEARIVLWGEREQLRHRVIAFSVGIGVDQHRHPIIAACSESERDPYAAVWHLTRFDLDFEHEISWPA